MGCWVVFLLLFFNQKEKVLIKHLFPLLKSTFIFAYLLSMKDNCSQQQKTKKHFYTRVNHTYKESQNFVSPQKNVKKDQENEILNIS